MLPLATISEGIGDGPLSTLSQGFLVLSVVALAIALDSDYYITSRIGYALITADYENLNTAIVAVPGAVRIVENG